MFLLMKGGVACPYLEIPKGRRFLSLAQSPLRTRKVGKARIADATTLLTKDKGDKKMASSSTS
jgi:hypothetical protein